MLTAGAKSRMSVSCKSARTWSALTINVAITGPCGIRNARVYRPSEKSSTPRAQ